MPTVGQRSRWSMRSRGKQTGWNHFDIWGLLKQKSFKVKWFSIWPKFVHLYLVIFIKKTFQISCLLDLTIFELGSLCQSRLTLSPLSSCLVTWMLAWLVDGPSQSRLMRPYLNGSVWNHAVWAQCRHIVWKSLLIVHREEKWLKQGELSVMVCTSNPNNSQGWGRKILTLRLALATQRDLI